MTKAQWEIGLIKGVVFLLALIPLGSLLYGAEMGTLSANPIKDITEETGVWTLRFIVITLSITPLRKITGWSRFARFRRMAGLFAFFYGFLHFMTYVYLDQFFAFDEILKDVAKRPFITVGFAAFVMMIPLAVTSPQRVLRWMGGKRWTALHRLVYAVALFGVFHYLWLVKADTSRPLRYGAVVAVLLLFRLWDYIRGKIRKARPKSNRSAVVAQELDGAS
ncbi:MAG TPA: protein-methionine-sulfoxide reductase heme-binding subunit MsrQ [Bacteroidota bacterium]|nr:protein-methionine-sulfoxide reductase heme-binding subunit MsrQ [Bacteroidota bacterium]